MPRTRLNVLENTYWSENPSCAAIAFMGSSVVATSPPRELAPLPWGPNVWDSIPWDIACASASEGKSLTWLASEHAREMPAQVAVDIGCAGSVLHVLHAVYGECTEGQPVATYRVVYADGTVQQANIQNSREIADWWMPYGHRFGGGGTLRIDPACCRLAYVSGCDQFQGHGLYLYWRALERRSTEVAHVEFVGSAERASVIVAAVTVEQ